MSFIEFLVEETKDEVSELLLSKYGKTGVTAGDFVVTGTGGTIRGDVYINFESSKLDIQINLSYSPSKKILGIQVRDISSGIKQDKNGFDEDIKNFTAKSIESLNSLLTKYAKKYTDNIEKKKSSNQDKLQKFIKKSNDPKTNKEWKMIESEIETLYNSFENVKKLLDAFMRELPDDVQFSSEKLQQTRAKLIAYRKDITPGFLNNLAKDVKKAGKIVKETV